MKKWPVWLLIIAILLGWECIESLIDYDLMSTGDWIYCSVSEFLALILLIIAIWVDRKE